MKKDFIRAVSEELKNARIPHGLYESVLFRIDKERRKRAYIGMISSSLISVFSALSMYGFAGYITDGLYRSGFLEFISLAVSDTSAVLLMWREFLYSLAESLPVFESAMFLSLSLLLYISAGIVWGKFKELSKYTRGAGTKIV